MKQPQRILLKLLPKTKMNTINAQKHSLINKKKKSLQKDFWRRFIKTTMQEQAVHPILPYS